MWRSSMAGEAGSGRCRSHQNVAVILVLCYLVPSLTCFSLERVSKNVKQDEVVNEATVMGEVWTGSINFNGKELDSQAGYASVAATGNDGWLSTDLDESDGSGMFEEATGYEAAWMRLKASLQCGPNKMEFKAMGPGAADLQLDMGNAHSLPLIQVPKTCKYSVKQNELGLVFVVPYDGCNVIQKNGNYVLPMRWLETPVKFTCPMLPSFTTTPVSTTLKSAQQPRNLPLPHGLWSLKRRKRHANHPLSTYDLYRLYYNMLNYYSMYMMTPAPTPDTTTMTTKPSTEKPPQKYPSAYPYYFYYPFYYPYLYYPLPNVPMQTTTAPTTAKPTTAPTTTAEPTTAPTTTAEPTTAPTTTAEPTTAPTTTAEPTTAPTTAKPTTTTSGVTSEMTTKTPRYPYYPYPYPYYPPMGQQFPSFPDDAHLYYYQIIQHYYGNTPYPQIPNTPIQTAQPPTNKPSNPTATPKPDDATTQPGGSSPTTKQTTVCTPTSTCTTKPSSNYPGTLSPYVPFPKLPFTPYVLYKSNNAVKLPDDQKALPPATYKSVHGSKADPSPHPGFPYWNPVPWFHRFTGKNDGKNLQPSHV
uniref:adhesive plaque matrix protein-like n=1 Tax=Scatophagus argus TaxID=75038 RepID=UPI001ED819F4|nr:adhesive plaque matrix protein-like [Scatophagus argus]